MPQRKPKSATTTRAWNPTLPPANASLVLNLENGEDVVLRPRAVPLNLPHGQAWMGDGIVVIASIEVSRHGRLLHASVSQADGQLPPWPVIAAVKRALFPDTVAAMMPLPEESNYVNVAEVLHVIQLPVAWGDEV